MGVDILFPQPHGQRCSTAPYSCDIYKTPSSSFSGMVLLNRGSSCVSLFGMVGVLFFYKNIFGCVLGGDGGFAGGETTCEIYTI